MRRWFVRAGGSFMMMRSAGCCGLGEAVQSSSQARPRLCSSSVPCPDLGVSGQDGGAMAVRFRRLVGEGDGMPAGWLQEFRITTRWRMSAVVSGPSEPQSWRAASWTLLQSELGPLGFRQSASRRWWEPFGMAGPHPCRLIVPVKEYVPWGKN